MMTLAACEVNEINTLSQKKVLIIDDEEEICEFLRGFLKSENIHAEYLCRANEVLGRLRTDPSYAVMIIDLKLRGINGLELIKKIRKASPEVIFIIITGYPDMNSAISAVNENVFGFITKPISLEEVRISVRNALEKHHLIIENRRLLESLRMAIRQLVEAQKELEKANQTLNNRVVHTEYELCSAKQALEERKLVEIAKGILMKQLKMNEDEAMKMIQKHSRRKRCRLVELANIIIEAEKNDIHDRSVGLTPICSNKRPYTK